MHILLLTSWYKTEQNPMKGTFFEEQARGLMARGHKVSIMFPEFKGFSDQNEIKEEVLNDNGLITYYIPFKAKIPKAKNWNYKSFQKHVLKAFKKYVDQQGTPDIIHVHTVFYAGIAAAYIKRKMGVPYVLTEHFTPFITGGITEPKDLKISKEVFELAKKNIAVSTGFKRLLEEKLELNDNTFVAIPNMVNPIFLKAPLTKNQEKNHKFTFFTMSFLTERKNHKLMLNAFKQFHHEYSESRFVIGGDGTIREEIEKQIVDLGLEDVVVMLGQMNRTEVLEQMKKSDCFLLASTFETFGVVLIEAMACGVPFVSTDSVGPRDIVNQKNGVLTKSFEVKDYLEGMKTIYVNRGQYNRDTIREDCNSRFSQEVVLSQLEQIYKL